jgi:hypothetical protein
MGKDENGTSIHFSFKNYVQPCHLTGVDVHAWHMSQWHTSALTWLPFLFYFNDFIYIYIKIWGDCPQFWPKGWLSYLQGIISNTYSNHRGHIMKFIKPQWYILEKKNMCLSNKHLVIFWVISIGHAYNFVFSIVTHDWLCFVFSFLFIYF